MSHGLFRKEVIQARRGAWLGSIQVATPLSRWCMTLLAATLASMIVIFLVFGHYTRRSRVSGELVPTHGLLAVEADINGTVDKVMVREGQHVRKGQPLLEIDADADTSRLGDVHAEISRRLSEQRTGLESDLLTRRKAVRQQTHDLRHRIALLRAQQVQITSQRQLQKQRVSSDRKLLQHILPLGRKGYVSAFRVQQLRSQLLQDQNQGKTLIRLNLHVEQKVAQAQHKLSELPLDLEAKRIATKRQVNVIEQQLAKNEAQRSVVLRAPRDGVVTTLVATPGQSVSTGQSLVSILPRGSRLLARLLVPSRAIGFVTPGSQVVLRYRAYPYQKFGQQYGRIESISRSALSPSQIVQLTGRRSRQPLYRVDVHLDRQDMPAYGKSQLLMPGMALSADILMERRTLLEWVFEPLYGLGRHILATEVRHGGR